MMHGFGRPVSPTRPGHRRHTHAGPSSTLAPAPTAPDRPRLSRPRPGPGPGPDQSTRAWYTSARSWARNGYEADGISWVMNTTIRSSTGSIQKAVLAAPPQ
jgi:hypothetical protein